MGANSLAIILLVLPVLGGGEYGYSRSRAYRARRSLTCRLRTPAAGPVYGEPMPQSSEMFPQG
jgi:hypothetical protein